MQRLRQLQATAQKINAGGKTACGVAGERCPLRVPVTAATDVRRGFGIVDVAIGKMLADRGGETPSSGWSASRIG